MPEFNVSSGRPYYSEVTARLVSKVQEHYLQLASQNLSQHNNTPTTASSTQTSDPSLSASTTRTRPDSPSVNSVEPGHEDESVNVDDNLLTVTSKEQSHRLSYWLRLYRAR